MRENKVLMTVLCLLVAGCIGGCDLNASAVWNVIRNVQVGPDGAPFFNIDHWRRDTNDNDHGGWDVDASVEWVCWPLCD